MMRTKITQNAVLPRPVHFLHVLIFHFRQQIIIWRLYGVIAKVFGHSLDHLDTWKTPVFSLTDQCLLAADSHHHLVRWGNTMLPHQVPYRGVGDGDIGEITSLFVQLDEKVGRLWQMENDMNDTGGSYSVEDLEVIDLCEREIKQENGHYVLPIPWRNGCWKLSYCSLALSHRYLYICK